MEATVDHLDKDGGGCSKVVEGRGFTCFFVRQIFLDPNPLMPPFFSKLDSVYILLEKGDEVDFGVNGVDITEYSKDLTERALGNVK